MYAFEALKGVGLLNPDAAQARYGVDTAQTDIRIAGAVLLYESKALQAVLRQANAHRLQLWPISGGRNFGYGTRTPSVDNCVILDLSCLKAIQWNSASETVTVEAGVTLQELYDFLQLQQLPYLVPITGAGGHGSLVGNALDGGYGMTPVQEHFQAISRVEGCWGNGLPMASLLEENNLVEAANRWPLGVGPQTLGLLRQGNFGVVTSATIRLRRKPEASGIVAFEWRSLGDFMADQASLARVMDEASAVSGFMGMSAGRALASQEPVLLFADSYLRTEDKLFDLQKKFRMAAWNGYATLYGGKETVKGSAAFIRRTVKHAKVTGLSEPTMERLSRWGTQLKPWLPEGLSRKLQGVGALRNLLIGKPHEEFLRLAYSVKNGPQFDAKDVNPARDGVGLFWYAPLIAANEKDVRQQLGRSESILRAHQLPFLPSLTLRDSRNYVATIPVIFNKATETKRAEACLSELVEEGIALGQPPYRLGAREWKFLRQAAPSEQWVQLKKALDPNSILAPLRGGV